MKKRVVFIKEFCEIMGMSESAVRSHLQRATYEKDGGGVLPRPFRLGRKLAWTTDIIESFLLEKELEAAGHSASQIQCRKSNER